MEIIKVKTNDVLIHDFVNNKLRKNVEYSVNNYKVINNKLYLFHNLIAILNTEKKVLIVKEFNHKSSFGDGLNSYTIKKYSFKYKTIILKELPSKYLFKNLKHFKKYLDLYFLKDNELCFIAYLKEVAKSPNLIRNLDYFLNTKDYNNLFSNIIDLIEIIKPAYKKHFLNYKINKRIIYENFTSYTKSSIYTYDLKNIKVNEIINGEFLNNLFSEQELQILNFKSWRLKYRRKNNIYIDTHQKDFEIYKCKEKKEAAENIYLDYLENLKKRKEIEKYEKCIKNILEIHSFIKSGNKIRSFLNLHFLYLKDSFVYTSMGVIIPLNSCKLLYKSIKNNNLSNFETFEGFNNHGIIKKDFIFCTIEDFNSNKKLTNDDVKNREIEVLQIGCHNIPIFEIENFVKRNNLN